MELMSKSFVDCPFKGVTMIKAIAKRQNGNFSSVLADNFRLSKKEFILPPTALKFCVVVLFSLKRLWILSIRMKIYVTEITSPGNSCLVLKLCY
jgi:hypothetical protein